MTSSGIGLLQWVANAVGPGSVAACGLFISSCYCFHPEAFRPVTAPRSGDPWSRRAPFHPVYSWYYDILVQGIAGGLGQAGPAQCLLQQAMCGGISRPRAVMEPPPPQASSQHALGAEGVEDPRENTARQHNEGIHSSSSSHTGISIKAPRWAGAKGPALGPPGPPLLTRAVVPAAQGLNLLALLIAARGPPAASGPVPRNLCPGSAAPKGDRDLAAVETLPDELINHCPGDQCGAVTSSVYDVLLSYPRVLLTVQPSNAPPFTLELLPRALEQCGAGASERETLRPGDSGARRRQGCKPNWWLS
ncbi:unnamed protein product [Gadus morhua 'NCC']